ncbi:hypothetical protein NQZ68_022972 [Dissostichus eleginoides]|nr:hypothetical protein NQZ68_022972 [Dissostichus eleginoides]
MPPCQCSMPGFGKEPREDAALPLRCKMSQSVDITDLQNVSDRANLCCRETLCPIQRRTVSFKHHPFLSLIPSALKKDPGSLKRGRGPEPFKVRANNPSTRYSVSVNNNTLRLCTPLLQPSTPPLSQCAKVRAYGRPIASRPTPLMCGDLLRNPAARPVKLHLKLRKNVRIHAKDKEFESHSREHYPPRPLKKYHNPIKRPGLRATLDGTNGSLVHWLKPVEEFDR